MNAIKQITRFWEGKLTNVKKQELLDLLSSNDDKLRRILEKIYFESLTSSSQNVEFEEQRAKSVLESIRSKIYQGNKIKLTVKGWCLNIAASIAIIFSVGFILYKTNNSQKALTVTTIPQLKAAQVYKNSTHTSKTILLSDSSIVELSPNSTLTKHMNFGVTNRKINLIGTAKFKVRKDKLHPFVVYCNEVSTTAIGTVFLIKGDKNNQVRIKLFEGKVAVHVQNNENKIQSTYLLPGETALVDKQLGVIAMLSKRTFKKKSKMPLKYSLDFKKERLSSVFDLLSKAYQLNIDYSGVPRISRVVFTGNLKKAKNIDSLLNIICTINDLNYIKLSQTIIIKEK